MTRIVLGPGTKPIIFKPAAEQGIDPAWLGVRI